MFYHGWFGRDIIARKLSGNRQPPGQAQTENRVDLGQRLDTLIALPIHPDAGMAHLSLNRAARVATLALTAGLLLAGCYQPSPTDVGTSAANSPAPSTIESEPAPARGSDEPMPTTPFNLSAFNDLTDEQLKAGYQLSLQENRFMAPGYNNTVAYLLAMRHRIGDPSYHTMLVGAAPEVMIQAERAIERGDQGERARLISMLEAINPDLPSLDRLKSMPDGANVWGEGDQESQEIENQAPEGSLEQDETSS